MTDDILVVLHLFTFVYLHLLLMFLIGDSPVIFLDTLQIKHTYALKGMILLLLLGNIFIYLEKLVQRYHYVTFDSIFTGNLYLLMLCLQLMLT